MADNKLYKVAITLDGKYVHGKEYDKLVQVFYDEADGGDGCSYVSRKRNVNVRPGTDDTVWQKASDRGMKGEQGQAGPTGQNGASAGFGMPTATISGGVGTPSVQVTASGSDTAKVFNFAFSNLKGETGAAGETGATGPQGPAGVTSAVVSVDDTSGTPSASATVSEGVLSISFSGLKGDQGNSGYSGAAEELEVVNNDSDGGEGAAWSAERGKTIRRDLSQLEAKVTPLIDVYTRNETLDATSYPLRDFSIKTDGTYGTGATYKHCLVEINPGDLVKTTAPSGAFTRFCFVKSTTAPSSGGAIDLCTGQSCVEVSAGTSQTFIAPIDAVAFLFYRGQSPYPSTPDGIVITSAVKPIDNLESNDGDAPLSANQGRVMNEEINGVKTEVDGKVDIKIGKNLFNPNADGILVDRYISSDGRTPTSSGKNVSDYIPVSANTTYHLSADGDQALGTNYCAFYASDKTLLSTQYQDANTFTTPANCAFLRFTYNASHTKIMLEQNSQRTWYLAYDEIGGYLNEQQAAIEKLDETKVNKSFGRNLWDGTIAKADKYLDSAGAEKSNGSIDISAYVPVFPETDYCLSADGNVGVTSSSNMYLCYYDANKTFLSSRSTYYKTFTTPANCAFIRFSILRTRTQIQLEYGSTRSLYQPYTPIGGYYAALQEKQVDYTNLNDGLRELIGASVLKFDSFRGSGTLAAGASLTLLNNFVKKNILFVAHIEGTIENVKIGVGGTALTAYNGYYVELTDTTISVKRMDTGGTHATATHGMTLTGHTTVYIDTRIMDPASVEQDNTIAVNVTLCDNLGHTFVLNSDNYWGYGTPFITNGNASASLDVSLSFFPKDEIKDVWVFGDSYCEFTYLQKRLTYWLFLNGYTNFLLCAKGGVAQDDQLPVLQSLLGLGHKPAFAVWLLGMNDGYDTVSGETVTVNSTAKTNLDNFIAMCQSNNIVPILATIPTVPTRQHTGLSNYVKSLGLRYIDIAGAVGSDINGNWYTGLLSDDGVHPTTAGSKVIFEQILIDFPEISVMD